ncbi:hypothetical protein KEM52_002702, partial [Ascosphaera acerosa]
CRLVHKAPDKCAWVRSECSDHDNGVFSYIRLYYCTLSQAKPLALIIIILWLALLFSTVGITASDFLCIDLSTLANALGMSESLAGVTFLAFGNGSPDLFSTFAAMSSGSGSLAVGELFGAASFITAVVAGSMALVRPFKVARRSFVRDICFFIASAAFTMYAISDGRLPLWECVVMLPAWRPGTHARDIEQGHASTDQAILDDDEAEEEADTHYLSELQKNMRLNRALAGQRRRTITSIRPSLVGALEFRSVLHTLQKARDNQMPIYLREHETGDGTVTPEHIRASYDVTQLPRTLSPGTPCSRAATLPDTFERDSAAQREVHSDQPVFNVEVRPPSLDVSGSGRGSVLQNVNNANETQAVSDHEMPRIDIRPPSIDLRPEGLMGLQTRDSGTLHSAQAGDIADLAADSKPLAPAIVFRASEGDEESLRRRKRRGPQLVISTENLKGDIRVRPHSHSIKRSPHSSPNRSVRSVPWERERGDLDRQHVQQQAEMAVKEHLAPVTPTFLDPNYLTPDRESRGTRSSSASRSSPTRSPRSAKSPVPPRLPRWSSQSPRSRSSRAPSRGSVRDRSPYAFARTDRPVTPLSPFPAYSDDERSSVSVIMPDRDYPIEAAIPNGIVPPTEPEEPRWWPRSLFPAPYVMIATFFPTLYAWKEKSLWEKFLGVIAAPSVFVLTLTLPVVEPKEADLDAPQVNSQSSVSSSVPPDSAIPLTEDQAVHDQTWGRLERADSELPVPVGGGERSPAGEAAKEWSTWLLRLQLFTGPLFIAIVVWSHLARSKSNGARTLLLPVLVTFGISVVLCTVFVLFSRRYKDMPPYSRPAFALLGFAVAIAWIATLSQEIVNCLKTVGVVLKISDALLGLTIFAFGNSVGDLIANITVARLGHPVMALAACFGSPMLNILLGIGLGGLYVNVRPKTREGNSSSTGSSSSAYRFDVSKTLLITGGAVLLNLVGLLTCVPWNKWRMDRKIGFALIGLWVVTTAVNVAVEVTLDRGSTSS